MQATFYVTFYIFTFFCRLSILSSDFLSVNDENKKKLGSNEYYISYGDFLSEPIIISNIPE